MATEDLKVEEHEDGTITVSDPSEAKREVPQEEHEDDERAVASADDGEEEETDAEAPEGETEDEAEARRSKTEENRMKRHAKKQAMRERTDRLRSELAARDALIADLTQRVAQQERKTTGSEMAQLDNEIRKAAEAYNFFKTTIATHQGNPEAGKTVADAMEKMVLASRRYEDLNRVKQQVVNQQNQPQAIDPVLLNHGKQWMERNPWYNPENGDEDSDIALAVDRRMAADGWNPRTPEYWEELDRRLQKRLPHKYKKGYNTSQSRPKSVVTGSGRETGNSGGNGGTSYTLSRERVAAMREAGIWDDPKARADMIRRYREQDKRDAA